MNFFIQRSKLSDLYDKVATGERISEADALRLFESKDLNALGAIADLARQKKVGNRASYIVNRYINYSNYCILSCQFCSFARKKRDADGFELTIPQMVGKAREALKLGITELHIVGGLHPSLPFSYYTDMLKALSALNSNPGVGAGPPPPTNPPPNTVGSCGAGTGGHKKEPPARGRPRPQQLTQTKTRWQVLALKRVSTYLRPRTGALRLDCNSNASPRLKSCTSLGSRRSPSSRR